MRYSATLLAVLLVGVSAVAVTSCSVKPLSQPEMRAELGKLDGPEVGSVDKSLNSQAEKAVSVGDFRRASQMYKQLADEHPDNKEYTIALADSLRRMGDNDDALKVINEYIGKHPDDAAALEVKGLSQMGLGEFSDASKTFDKVMSVDGKRWRTLNALGIMFAIKKMEPQAIAYYNAALEVSPDNPGVLNNLGLSLAMDKQYDKAVDTFMHARSHVESKSAQRRHIDLDLALVYALAGRLDDAEQTASPHLNKAELYNNMAFYAYISKNTELAKTYLNMALTQDPAYYERAWKNLAAINGDAAAESNSEEDVKVQQVLHGEGNLTAPDLVDKPATRKEAPPVARKSAPVSAFDTPAAPQKMDAPKPNSVAPAVTAPATASVQAPAPAAAAPAPAPVVAPAPVITSAPAQAAPPAAPNEGQSWSSAPLTASSPAAAKHDRDNGRNDQRPNMFSSWFGSSSDKEADRALPPATDAAPAVAAPATASAEDSAKKDEQPPAPVFNTPSVAPSAPATPAQ